MRERKKPVIRVALSPNECAATLDIRPDYIARAIKGKELAVYQYGLKRRVLVCDLIAWVKTWPERKERIARIKRRHAKEHDDLLASLFVPTNSARQTEAITQKLIKLEALWRDQ